MAGLDWVIIGLYFAMLLGIAWWVARRNRDTADDYFLAGRNLGWFLVGATIFASNIGSEHVVGLAGAGATSGVALAHYELHAWCLLVLGWVFVPFYARALVYTMPEFLGRRFSPTARWVLSVITLAAHVLTKFAVAIFAGGVVFATLLPDVAVRVGGATFNSFWIGTVAVVLLTGLYTVLGGMRAVAYTDALQTFILLVGSGLLTVFGLAKLGGWHELRRVIDPDLFNLWKPIVPAGMEGSWAPVKEAGRIAWYFNGNYPWPGMLLCAPIIGLWYWCTDQYIVQRALSAKNEGTARRGSIFAAYLKLFPVFIFIIPGLIALALAKTGRVPGLGVILDAQGHPIPQAAQGYLAPPIFTVFVFGIFNRRLNSKGCLAALIVGFVLGVFRLAVDTPVSLHLAGFADGYAPGSFLWIVNNLYFQYYSVFIFVVSVIVMFVVSYATAPPTPEQVAGLTYGTVAAQDRALSRSSWNRLDVIGPGGVLLLILAVYLYFRG